jgi:CRISPR-associated protein (TIGR03984 family)
MTGWLDRGALQLHGCTITPLDGSACDALVAAIASGDPSAAPETTWLLAYCDDGVIWGVRRQSGWRLSSSVFPDVSPPLVRARIQELRLFGRDRELLLWRTDDGLRGRWLTDAIHDDADSVLSPKDEIILLLGNRSVGPSQDGFTLVAEASGSCQAVPLVCNDSEFREGRNWPLRLRLRHFFASDPDSGVVRISATRFVDVFKE